MRKLRSDAIWHKLTPEQQKKIEHWFFVEHLGYRAVRERMRSEFGLNCALSIIGPMYHYLHESRSQEREAVMDRLSEILVAPGCELKRVRPEALTVISGRLMRRALEQGDQQGVASLGHLMVKSGQNLIEQRRLEHDKKKLGLNGLVLALKAGAISRTDFLRELRGEFQDSEPLNDER